MRPYCFLVICSALALVACAAPTPPAPPAPAVEPLPAATLSKEEIAAVQNGIKRKLKDPDSAKFGAMNAGRLTDRTVVCGWVNAKNSYGGYTGMEPYIGYIFFKPLNFEPQTIANGELGVTGVRRMCRDDGITLPASP